MKRAVTLAALAALLASPALSQHSATHQGHSGMGQMNHDQMNHGQMHHGQTMMQPTAANPYPPAEMRMHERMMGAVGANADETWVRKMIEHHRGAIEMSKILIARGADRAAKDMARKSMAQQQKEVGELQNWLRRNGKKPQ